MGDAQGRRRPRLADRVRAVPWLIGHAPWWVSLGVGVVLTGAGLFLIVRPLSALGVLGIYVGISCVITGLADLLTDPGGQDDRPARHPRDAARAAGGWIWILAGVVILAWVGRDVSVFGPTVAALLIASGGLAIVQLAIERSLMRLTRAILGAAEILFGLLAFVWPDATLIVVATLFGGRTVLYGLSLLLRAIARGPAMRQAASGPRRRALPALHLIGATCVLALAIATAVISHELRRGVPPADAFYDTPDTLPDTPGTLIRWDEYDGDLPAGLTGYRLYYTTTNADGDIVPTSGLLTLPTDGTGPFPLITWSHGTVGVARHCAPSQGPDGVIVGGQPAAAQLAELGWAMVSSDYPGMGAEGATPYLIGEGEGRAVLDAARAARQFPQASFTEQTVVWGHSQGGHGALWAGQLAPSYAPDVDVVGTVALSPASRPRALAEVVLAHPGALGASLAIAYVVDAYTQYYPQLSFDQIVPPVARPIVREAASRCTGEGGTLVTVLAGLSVARDRPLVQTEALDGKFGDLLDANEALGPWEAPIFVGQGEDDEVIPFSINEAYVESLCATGTDIEFHGYPAGTHMSILEDGSELNADVIAWTEARFAGAPSTPTC